MSYEDYGVHSLVNGVISTSDEKLINLSNINNKPLVDAIKEKYKQYVIYKNDKYYINKNTLQIIGNFDLSNSDITSLEGIELFDSVYEIDLSNNKITDIDKLKDFTNLDNLNLSNNKIKDVSVLKNNKQLRILNLENNIDVKGYGEISSLYNLNLKNCNVQNLDELENLRKLNGITQLNIINNTSENNEDTIIEGNDKEIILDIIEKLNYNRRICAEINQYTIQLDNGTVYGIKESSKEILKGDKQAKISDKDLNTILNIIEKNKLK